jgi:hypothetical protein
VSIAGRIRNMPVNELAEEVKALLPAGQSIRVVQGRIELIEPGQPPSRLSEDRLRHDLIIHQRLSARL